MTLFDYYESKKLRNAGMESAAKGRKEYLTKARSIAFQIASIYPGTVTADQVRAEYEYRGGDWANDLGNAAGSIFKEAKWECIGFENSKVTTSHARALRVWRLK